MMTRAITIILAAIVALCTSCIKNDIPYPVIKMEILSLEVEGVEGECQIDYVNRTVTIPLKESTDIRNVRIKSAEVTEGATLSTPIEGTFDLRYPQYITLSLYQDYEWVIIAEQTIDRRFSVIGQIGETEWDVSRNIAKAYRRADYGLDTVTVTQLRFGPKPEYDYPDASTIRNFSNENHTQTATVDAYGRREIWRLIVEPREVQIDITRCVGGGEVIWLRATGIDGAQTGFRYRKKGVEEWSELEDAWYVSRGGIIEATVRHLTPETPYEVIGYTISDKGEQRSEIREVSTTKIFVLPNASFEEWSYTGDVYYPYLNPDNMWWGTGNPASKIAGINLTTPHTGTLPPEHTGQCAQLWSQKASVMGIGKFAAGNLFAGEFDRIVGTNGLVLFGRPFTLRPTGLRCWARYNMGVVDCVPNNITAGKTPAKGDNDSGSIYIALGDWDHNVYGGTPTSPVLVDTRDESTFFTSSNPNIIAWGELRFDASCDWTEFNIPLEYRTFDKEPTHIIIVCSGSRFGDYFVGSTNSIMWVDDFELLFDIK